MGDKGASALRNLLSKLPFKAPWKYTGVASTPEYANYLPPATEYRKHAPGSPPIRASIPQAETDRVLDIKYYVRDSRRQGQLVGGTNKKHEVTYKYDATAPDPDLEGSELPPTVGKPYKWGKRVSLLDFPNNGYT
eukprot:jgi/Botrbrau1/8306/Bobra.0251s0032.1